MEELESRMPYEEFLKFVKDGYYVIRRNHELWACVSLDMTIEKCLMRLLKVQGGRTHGRGISNSQRAYFVLTFPGFLKVCETMERLTGMKDAETSMSWIKQHSPWTESNCLRSLSSGVIGHEKIYCHNALSVGSAAINTTIGSNFADVKLTIKKNRLLPLAAVNKSIAIRDEVMPLNPQQLFMLIVWAVNNNAGDILHYLMYELTPRPPVLFDDVSIRKTAKSALLDVLNSASAPEILQETSTFIINGGYILRVLVWPRPATFGTVVESYIQYVVRHYSTFTIVVCDGYDDVMSTKGEERNRHSLHKTYPNMSLDSSTIITVSQADFLSYGHNKARLISMLSQEFNHAGLKVHQAVADADTLLVRAALQGATEGREVIVVATDTDILIMLLARAHEGTIVHLFSPEPKIYSVVDIQRQIGAKKICLLFVHVVTGCETTSAVFGNGKKKAWKLLEKPNVQSIAAVFNNPSADKGQIITAGKQFLIQLYTNEDFTSLEELRGRMYAHSLQGRQPPTHLNLRPFRLPAQLASSTASGHICR
ncbi:hypothetical protein PR048_019837 [Dryococelus australis]|uniref:NYN domain-containing protein n=1 Tax=Dryococelus australis TaxID=614101 RepID=A0ABQ9H4U7_9NEOP|nr:hypothetical protein PR048_019837 [Dryococelus australis]